jgi:hypothetical protein
MTTPSNWEKVRAIFHGALDRPLDQRATFVLEQAGDDPGVRKEVESLLAAHVEADRFLEKSSSSLETPRLKRGTRLGAFEIVGLIGTGGMGEVYRARDTRLDRTVAIKILSPDLVSDPRGRERFEREGRVISKLAHPNICTLHDVGSATADGGEVPFLVMELLDGETLATRLARGPLPVQQALKYAAEIAGALAGAHAQGIVHRDLKPSNIMLTKSGAKLLDFGLARLRVPASADGSPPAEGAVDESLTRDGLLIGTLPYMAPEQVRGHDADARTDLFAFGTIVYEMLTGARAFAGNSQADLIAAILEHQPPPVTARQPLTPLALERLVTNCLAKDPADRWQSAHDVGLALKAISDGSAEGTAVAGSRWRLHAAWAALVVALGVGLWAFRPDRGGAVPPPNPAPVIVLMDSTLPGRVYDPRTLAAGGTNADDVSDALRELRVLTHKENTSAVWHREEQVRQQNPDLVVSHLSCLLDIRPANGDRAIEDHLFEVAQNRLLGFLAYLAASNPRTQFLIYSRGRVWRPPEVHAAWTRDVVARFPRLEGRLSTMIVPGSANATFRDPATAELLRTRVKDILRLP